jgi:hypothetical protein
VNNKRSVYLLLPLVLLVWGLIGWRIWAATSDPDPEAGPLQPSALRSRPVAARSRPRLLLTYGDPFKPGASRPAPSSGGPVPVVSFAPSAPTTNQAARLNFPAHPAVPVASTPSITWPQVKYLGVISHAGGEAQVALLAIDNQELVVKAGKSERGVQVIKLFRDSVQLSFSGQKKSFLRSAAN